MYFVETSSKWYSLQGL